MNFEKLSVDLHPVDGLDWRVMNCTVGGRTFADTPCLVMYDAQGSAQDALYLKDGKYRQLHHKKGVAARIGDFNNASSYHMIAGVEDAKLLYDALKEHLQSPCVFIGDNPQDFADCQPLTIYSTLDNKGQLARLPIDATARFAIAKPSDVPNEFSQDWQAFYSDTLQLHAEHWQAVTLPPMGSYSNHYPLDALPDGLRAVVNRIHFHSQAPLSWCAFSVLGALSTIAQGKINAPMMRSSQPVSLFLITQGESGGGKSTAQKLAYLEIEKYEQELKREYAQALSEWRADYASAKRSEKGELMADKPKNPAFVQDGGTIERFFDNFTIHERDNLAYISSEAGGLFGGYSMKSDTVASVLGLFTSGWDGAPIRRQLSTRGAVVFDNDTAYNVRVTLDVSGQPVIIKQAMNDPLLLEQGFLPRCLITAEPAPHGKRDFISPERLAANSRTDAVLCDFWAWCAKMLRQKGDYFPSDDNAFTDSYNRDAKGRINLPLSEEAIYCLAAFMQHIENLQGDGEMLADVRAFASRMGQNACRIATLFAFYRGAIQVGSDELERAFKIVWHSMNELLGYGQDDDAHDVLGDLIKKADKSGKFTYSEAQKAVKKRYRNKAVFADILQTLEEHHALKVIELPSKSKRPPREVLINPALLK